MSNFLTIKRSNDIKYDVIIEVDGHGEGLGVFKGVSDNLKKEYINDEVELKLKKFTSKECFDLLIIYKEFDLKDDNNELIDKLQNHIIEKFREQYRQYVQKKAKKKFAMKSIKRVYEEDSDTSSLSSNLLTETEDSLSEGEASSTSSLSSIGSLSSLSSLSSSNISSNSFNGSRIGNSNNYSNSNINNEIDNRVSVRINNSNAIAGANNYDINPKVVICNDNNSSIIRHIRNIGNRNRNIINKNTNTNTNNNNNNDYRGSINSIRRSTRIIRNTTINNNNQQQQPETKLCESCKILHLNVQKVGSLDLCLYCRSLFDDDIEFRSRRAQYGFELYKRVKVFYSDGGWYSATMMDVKDGRIRVHFDGWSDYFDEWIPAGSQRMKEMTIEEIVEAQKKLDVMKKDEGLIEQTENFYKSLLKRNNKQLINNYANQSSFDFYFARNTRRSARNDVILTDGNILAKLKTRFKLGNKIEVRDRLREWMPATIIASKGCRILIHYDDVPAFYDEWIDITSDRLRVRQIIKEPDTYAHQNSSKAISSSLHLINKKDRHQRKSGKCDINDDNNQVSHLEFVVNGERIGSFEGAMGINFQIIMNILVVPLQY
ncbi:2206_t:CDS:2, partial [Entrophospora sp. SA101]